MAQQDGISIYGTKFVADIDFKTAIDAARTLDGVIKGIPTAIEQMVARSKAQLSQLTAAFQAAANAAAQIGSSALGGGVAPGVAGGAAAGVAPGVATAKPRRPRAPRATTTPASAQGDLFTPAAPSYGLVVYTGGAPEPISSPSPVAGPGNAIVPYGGRVSGGGVSIVPPPPASPPTTTGGGLVLYQRPPGGSRGPGGGYGGGDYYGGPPYSVDDVNRVYRWVNNRLPGPVAIDAEFRPVSRTPIPVPFDYEGLVGVTGRLRRFNEGIGGRFGYQNLMRAAAGLYVAQNVANVGRFIGQSTIGQAMDLEERTTLLENALMSEKLDISRSQARLRSAQLTTADYFAGMPVTAQEMGLSRVELAEQFRQLAPIVRLTAKNQDEFQAGLQTGALARALLVARDPVQGTKGSMVALSELYSGGPDRFRSLALRFELPRNRLLEIEREMGGPNVADPGQVLIQMLSEMGFGPQYLTMRSGTLAGQLDRSGALYENMRVELFTSAMNKVRDNLTRLNDAFEIFLNSDAGERALARLDDIFGRITSFLTNGATTVLGTTLGMAGDATNAGQLAQHISEYMTTRGGSYVSAAGKIVSAGEAFEEAARLITNKQFVQAMRSAVPNPNLGLLGLTAGGTVLGSIGAGMLNRFVLSGQAGNIFRAGITGGLGAAGSATLTAIGSGAAIPLAAIAALAGTGALLHQSQGIARDWRNFAQMAPELAAQAGVPTNVGAWGMANNWLNTWGARVAPLQLLASGINRAFGTNLSGAPPWMTDPRQKTWMALSQEAMREGSIKLPLRTQAALMMAEGNDPTVIRSGLVQTLMDYQAANPDATLTPDEMGAMVNFAMAPVLSGDLTVAGEVMAGVAARRAAVGGQQLVGPDGRVITATPGDFLTAAGQSALWSQILGMEGIDSQREGLDYLEGILAQLGVIAKNTEKDDAESAFSYIRPSMAGDVFTGYVQDPDMRFTLRTSLPRGSSARSSASSAASQPLSSLTIGGGRAAGAMGMYTLSKAEPYNSQHYNSFFNGIVLDSDSLYLARGGRHMGLDFTLGPGEHLAAPYAGTVEYLTSPEDYARYKDLLPSGYEMYGNSAVFTDLAGGKLTYSHLSDRTIDLYGNLTTVRAGQRFAVQGNTGMVEAAPGGDGTHVHTQFFLPNGQGGMTRVDPLFAESYFGNLPAMVGAAERGSPVNMQVGDLEFNISLTGDVQQDAKAAAEALLGSESVVSALTAAIVSAMTSGSAVAMYQRAKSVLARRGQ